MRKCVCLAQSFAGVIVAVGAGPNQTALELALESKFEVGGEYQPTWSKLCNQHTSVLVGPSGAI